MSTKTRIQYTGIRFMHNINNIKIHHNYKRNLNESKEAI